MKQNRTKHSLTTELTVRVNRLLVLAKRPQLNQTTVGRGAGCPKWEVFQGLWRHESPVGTSSNGYPHTKSRLQLFLGLLHFFFVPCSFKLHVTLNWIFWNWLNLLIVLFCRNQLWYRDKLSVQMSTVNWPLLYSLGETFCSHEEIKHL